MFPILADSAHSRADLRGSLDVLYEHQNVILKRSFSKKGVFRGMHRQYSPHEQTKLIRVISGRIIDFIVKPDGNNVIYWTEIDAFTDWVKIGPEFAHGFYALEDTVFEYICDGPYDERAEQSFSILEFLKTQLGILDPLLSDKDRLAPPLVVTPYLHQP